MLCEHSIVMNNKCPAGQSPAGHLFLQSQEILSISRLRVLTAVCIFLHRQELFRGN